MTPVPPIVGELGRLLRDARARRQLGKFEAARAAGVGTKRLHSWEKGQNLGQVVRFLRLLEFYGLELQVRFRDPD